MAAAPFHLVTDFDGVWTEPEREARAVYAHLVTELARVSGRPAEAVWELVERHAARVRAHPDRFGWPIEGVFTSYVDEDYFAFPAAVGRSIEEEREPEAAALHACVRREFPNMGAFLDHCYHSTGDRFRAEVRHDLAAGAERVLAWLLEQGMAVTFVTNAPLVKVVDWFGVNGVAVADARDPAHAAAPLRAYGRAGKQWLGDTSQALDCAGRLVRTDRPQYREILERERPEVVLGDVLSLDLAQPLALRAQRRPGAPAFVGLLRRAHTPRWVLDSVGPAAAQIDFAVHHVTQLPRVLSTLRASSSPVTG